jgi:hypothetical protein
VALTATDRLILVSVKIERAKKHLGDLQAEIALYGQREFHAFLTKANTNPTKVIKNLEKQRILTFDTLSLAGDIIHNLRSSLDHLANQLAWVGAGKEPSRLVEFPIAKDATTYERDKARKVEGIRPEVIKVIDALEPYKNGKGDVLWRIHELDNIDKHRTLFTYSHDAFLVADWLLDYSPFPYNLKASNPHFAGLGAFDREVEQKVEVEIDDAVSQSKISASNPLLPSLVQMVDYVNDLVRSFKPFLQ